MTSLRDRLRSRDSGTLQAAIREAVAQGEEGEAALADVLGSVSDNHDQILVMGLANARGDAGPGALRRVLQRSDASPGLVGMAVLALARRCGVAASAELMAALESED